MTKMIGIENVTVRVSPGGRDGQGKVDRNNMAIALGKTPKTMAEWKRLGIGPEQYLIGGRIFADWSSVQAWSRGEHSRQIAA